MGCFAREAPHILGYSRFSSDFPEPGAGASACPRVPSLGRLIASCPAPRSKISVLTTGGAENPSRTTREPSTATATKSPTTIPRTPIAEKKSVAKAMPCQPPATKPQDPAVPTVRSVMMEPALSTVRMAGKRVGRARDGGIGRSAAIGV